MARTLLLVGITLCALTARAAPEPTPPPTPTPTTTAPEAPVTAPSEKAAPDDPLKRGDVDNPAADADAAPTDGEAPLPEPDIYADDPMADELPGNGVADAVGVFLKTMLALGFILLLAYLTLSKGVGKLVAKSQQGKDIKVVERIGIDQRRALLLVEVDGRRFLIGTSESGMTTLADLSDKSGGRPFAEVMQHTPAAASGTSDLPDLPKGAAADGAPA